MTKVSGIRLFLYLAISQIAINSAIANIDKIRESLESQDSDKRKENIEIFETVHSEQAGEVVQLILAHYARIPSLYPLPKTNREKSVEQIINDNRRLQQLRDEELSFFAAALSKVLLGHPQHQGSVQEVLEAGIAANAKRATAREGARPNWNHMIAFLTNSHPTMVYLMLESPSSLVRAAALNAFQEFPRIINLGEESGRQIALAMIAAYGTNIKLASELPLLAWIGTEDVPAFLLQVVRNDKLALGNDARTAMEKQIGTLVAAVREYMSIKLTPLWNKHRHSIELVYIANHIDAFRQHSSHPTSATEVLAELEAFAMHESMPEHSRAFFAAQRQRNIEDAKNLLEHGLEGVSAEGIDNQLRLFATSLLILQSDTRTAAISSLANKLSEEQLEKMLFYADDLKLDDVLEDARKIHRCSMIAESILSNRSD